MSDHPEDFVQFNTDHNTLIENLFNEYAPPNWPSTISVLLYLCSVKFIINWEMEIIFTTRNWHSQHTGSNVVSLSLFYDTYFSYLWFFQRLVFLYMCILWCFKSIFVFKPFSSIYLWTVNKIPKLFDIFMNNFLPIVSFLSCPPYILFCANSVYKKQLQCSVFSWKI